jgi:ABC-type multidrug transport system permease subunit
MVRRILTIAWKEFLHLRKDRILVPFVILGAITELTLIAWATGQPIQNIGMTVVDQDHSAQSAALIQTLADSKTLDHQHDAASAAEVEQLMAKNATSIGVVIPPAYGAALLTNQRPTVQLILNGADALTAYTAETTAQQLIDQQALIDARGLQPADYQNDLPQITVRYNPDLDRGYYTLPAEMSFMFYLMTLILAAFAISRERERGTYEQLQVMPYRSWEVVIGKLIAPMVIGYGLFLIMLALTTLVFHVPLRGSLALLLVLAVVYLIAEIGKGILLSMTARTQLQAVMLVVGMAMLDMIFSGYAVAVETMSPFMQAVSNIFAIRHWLTIARGIMLKGVGLDVLWPSLAAIVVIGAVILSITFWAYRRSLR